MKMYQLRIATVLIAAVTASALVLTNSLEGSYVKTASGRMAGNCEDCEEGGKSCDKSNGADGITEGSGCQGTAVGSVAANCGGEKGLVKKPSKNSATVSEMGDQGQCPESTKAYECWDPDGPQGSANPVWKRTTVACGTKALCDAQGRVVNDPACKDTTVD